MGSFRQSLKSGLKRASCMGLTVYGFGFTGPIPGDQNGTLRSFGEPVGRSKGGPRESVVSVPVMKTYSPPSVLRRV